MYLPLFISFTKLLLHALFSIRIPQITVIIDEMNQMKIYLYAVSLCVCPLLSVKGSSIIVSTGIWNSW